MDATAPHARPQLASAARLRERIAAITRIRDRADVDFLKERLTLLFAGYAVSSPVLGPGQKIFRGVSWPELPRQVGQLRQPPPDRVRTWGRANRPFQPMFYASSARPAVFYELEAVPGQHLAISRWRLTDKIWINNVGFVESVFKKYGSARDHVPSWEKASAVNMTAANRLVHNFFAEAFAREITPGNEHEYKLSVAISEKLFGTITLDPPQSDAPEDGRFGGVVYPSLAMRANADNLVLLPEFADKYLTFEEVDFTRVDALTDGPGYQVTMLDYANSLSSAGEIEWKGRLPQWQLPSGGSLRFRVEDGQWVAYDLSAQRVETS